MSFIACNHQPLPWGHWNICRTLLCVNLIMVLIFCLSVFYKKAIRQANRRTLPGDQQEESIFLFGLSLFLLRTYCKRYSYLYCVLFDTPIFRGARLQKKNTSSQSIGFFFRFYLLFPCPLSSVRAGDDKTSGPGNLTVIWPPWECTFNYEHMIVCFRACLYTHVQAEKQAMRRRNCVQV